MITIVFAPFTPNANATWLPEADANVETETELVNAINTAPNNEGYLIYVHKDIKLGNPLEIPKNKIIGLIGGASLFGADGKDTIIIKSGGRLNLFWNIPITHVEGESGRGIYIERGGILVTNQAEISGNTADKGGGVYNEGEFTLNNDSVITNNTATEGGGVYNKGTLIIRNSVVYHNVATKGGGVYNVGVFENYEDVKSQIRSNIATSGEGANVFIGNNDRWQSYILFIGIVIVVAVGLFFYLLRRRKQKIVKDPVGSVNNVKWCGVIKTDVSMIVTAKSNSGLCGLFSRKTFFSLLFMVVLVSSVAISGCISSVSFFASGAETPDIVVKREAPSSSSSDLTYDLGARFEGAANVVVKSEVELRNAIGTAPDNTVYVISLSNDIMLGDHLYIPEGKNITLVSVGGVWSLFGADNDEAIEVGGLLVIDGIIVTHVAGNHGLGVAVNSGGTFILVDGRISNGSLNGRGAGVWNEGVFVMLGGEISSNGAVNGGGVYNKGVFEMYGGKILRNGAGDGAGVYNLGSFKMFGGEITNNLVGGGVYNDGGTFEWLGGVIENNMFHDETVKNVYYAEDALQADNFFDGGWWLYLLFGVVSLIIFVGLLFYCLRRRRQHAVKSLVSSVNIDNIVVCSIKDVCLYVFEC